MASPEALSRIEELMGSANAILHAEYSVSAMLKDAARLRIIGWHQSAEELSARETERLAEWLAGQVAIAELKRDRRALFARLCLHAEYARAATDAQKIDLAAVHIHLVQLCCELIKARLPDLERRL